MVFYRKYRPQTIEELDSKDVRDILHVLLGQGDVSHAFLFTGPKGLGKTSAARIVAKVVNCERLVSERLASSSKPQKLNAKRYTLEASVEPCNKCDQCVSITNGTNIDILEIDGASNRGIDEIRDLREKVRLSAARASKKVYIIDEVHMLTTEAFNALLKTLEEPPLHAIFILCTTEPHKLPQTIVSRCTHLSFKKAEAQELVRSFKRIAKKEKLDIDDEALSLVAGLSDGSFRDGVKILEEIALNAGNKKITKELVEQKYQIRQMADQISEMVEALSRKNTREGLAVVSKLTEHGLDTKYFIEQLINTLHSLLLRKVGVKSKEESINITYEFSIEEIKDLVELLSRAYTDLKYAVLPQLPLELTIIEWGIQKTQNQVRLGQNTQSVRGSDSQKIRESDGPKVRHSDSPSFPSVPKTSEAPRPSQTDNFWQELIDRVKSHNHSIAAVLRGCGLKEYDGKSLVIETKYKFHKDKLEDIKSRKLIERVCEEIARNRVSISVLLK